MKDSRKNYSVLMASYNQDSLKMTSEYINRMGCFQQKKTAFDGNEAIKRALEGAPPTIIIFDAILKNIDGIAMFRILKSFPKLKSTKFVILAQQELSFISEQAVKEGVDCALFRNIKFESFQQSISSLLFDKPPSEIKQQSLDEYRMLVNQISLILHKLGMPATLKGYYYSRYSILLTIEDETLLERMTSSLYPMIAQKFGTTKSCAERNMRHCIEHTWANGNISYIDEIFGYTVDANKGKPTNSQFIATIVDLLKRKIIL